MSEKIEKIVELINDRMITSGTSAKELAKASGVAYITIYRVLNKKATPHNSTLKKLLDALEISSDEIRNI